MTNETSTKDMVQQQIERLLDADRAMRIAREECALSSESISALDEAILQLNHDITDAQYSYLLHVND